MALFLVGLLLIAVCNHIDNGFTNLERNLRNFDADIDDRANYGTDTAAQRQTRGKCQAKLAGVAETVCFHRSWIGFKSRIDQRICTQFHPA